MCGGALRGRKGWCSFLLSLIYPVSRSTPAAKGLRTHWAGSAGLLPLRAACPPGQGAGGLRVGCVGCVQELAL